MKRKTKKNIPNKISNWTITFTILALILFISGFIIDYPENIYAFVGSIIVALCGFISMRLLY